MDEQRSAPARPLWDLIQKVSGKRDWSMSRLARESGVSRKTINNWKTQPRSPLAPSVIAVADVLQIDQEEALRLAGILRGDDQQTAGDPSIEELRAEVAELRRLNAEQQELNAAQERRTEELERRIEELTGSSQSHAKPTDDKGAGESGARSGRKAG